MALKSQVFVNALLHVCHVYYNVSVCGTQPVLWNAFARYDPHGAGLHLNNIHAKVPRIFPETSIEKLTKSYIIINKS